MKMLEFIIPPLPQFITVGHSWWKKGKAHFRRNWDIYDLIIVTNGTLYITEDDQPYTISAGSMLLLEPGRTHFGHRPCEQNTETYYVHFSHPVPPRELNSGGFEWSQTLQPPTDDDANPRAHTMYLPKHAEVGLPPLLQILDRMVEIRNHIFIRNALELHSLTSQLLLELQQVIHQTKPMSRSLELCTRMARYLESHMRETYSSKKLEDEFHFHIDYLSRCLKKHTGMTPLQYQHHIRLERAKQMLAHTMTSVQEIAYELGYEHSSYFIRTFRNKEGITPGAYRDRFVPGAN
ncbi:helix-turn-helix transcriptional regulator [Cohnella sp. LGH]|uniref:helix-turn-helix transcriptional regulator n=1 Tax=Cohnella sp. LGH TaxID=1619153 RepID=UPI001ADCF6BD|nr:AraC family transcriptional regulator [Cohnella sp. LGH]QTH40779.1 helix-turn-helix transcriptional regulator [Cohnella sp. LGH]